MSVINLRTMQTGSKIRLGTGKATIKFLDKEDLRPLSDIQSRVDE
ncbi:MAG TPA: hypothetical protein VJ799_08070 [Nitrososphaeraceae archaeon]|nr:hypothetical protein [Nitrososphaeraceae archaeon]